MADPGRYDEHSEALLRALEADVVIVFVKGGKFGDGFSLSTILGRDVTRAIVPGVLEQVAEHIRGGESDEPGEGPRDN